MENRLKRLLKIFEIVLAAQGEKKSYKRTMEISELRHRIEKALEQELMSLPIKERIKGWKEMEELKKFQYILHQS